MNRYSIEVTEEIVEIYGDLTIEETFDFLIFFERKGYQSVISGHQNSSLRMMKIDTKEILENTRISEMQIKVENYRTLWEEEKSHHESTKNKLISTEILTKELLSEEYKKNEELFSETMKLSRACRLEAMKQNPEVQIILQKNTDSNTQLFKMAEY